MARSIERDAQAFGASLVDLLQLHPAIGGLGLSCVPHPGSLRTGRWNIDFVLTAEIRSIWLSQHRAAYRSFLVTRQQVQDRGNHEGTARKLVGRLLEVQDRRHRAALANGLTTDADAALRLEAIAIDRVTAHLLARLDIDSSRLIEWHRRVSQDQGDEETVFAFGTLFEGVGAIGATLSEGDIVPTLACELTIGCGALAARLFGNVLDIDLAIPATLLAASPGRPLGDIVATGIRLLDDRRIASAADTDTGVAFTLEVDLTTIGEVGHAAS